MEKVSIIIPVYNAFNTIDKCIDSVIKQTYQNMEVLLINDGSKDNSIKKLKKYESKYDFIKVIDKENEGVAKTRNLGIQKATGKYVMFMDNDDFLEENYVEIYVDEIVNKDCDVVIGGFKRVNTKGKILYENGLKNTYWSRYIITAPWAKIFRRDYLIENKVEFLSYTIGEDVYFTLALFLNNPKTTIINYKGYNWLYNDNSVSNTVQKGLNDKIDIIYFLNKIYTLNKNKDSYINYYIKRYYVWYLLFSGRGATREKFIKENEKIKRWIKEKNITFNISPFSSKLKGEQLKNRLIVFSFCFLDKIKLIGLFARIYCRGDKE